MDIADFRKAVIAEMLGSLELDFDKCTFKSLISEEDIPMVPCDVSYDVLKEMDAFRPLWGRPFEPWGPDRLLNGGLQRTAHIAQFGFVALSTELLDTLARIIGKGAVLEAGCGSGYLSHALASRGVSIVASDKGERETLGFGILHAYRLDHEGASTELLPGVFDFVLLSWPPIGDAFAHEVARAMKPGQVLLYVGEWGAACADEGFTEYMDSGAFEELEEVSQALNRYHLRFQGLRDNWWAYRKV
jgi:hypothetical protein